MEMHVGPATIEFVRGDITLQDVDAIVNAANSRLAGGGGVDGAIHRAGGPSIMEECRRIGGCPTGSAVVTRGGNLRARWVLHAVGPVWRGGLAGEADLLGSAYERSLELAREKGVQSIAFPSLSTGAYGYPMRAAARVAIAAVARALQARPDGPVLVRFVLFNDADLEVYEEAAREASSTS